MSNMLEQAIIDAAMLREAALKNAEQSLIEKYAPQIKEAVEAMLEGETVSERHCGSKAMHEDRIVEIIEGINENGQYTVQAEGSPAYLALSEELTDMLQEEEVAAAPAGNSEISLPFAGDTGISPDQEVQFSVEAEVEPEFIEIDLGALRQELEGSDTVETDREDMAAELSSIDDLMGDLELDTAEPADVAAEPDPVDDATDALDAVADVEDTENNEEEDEMDGMLQELLSLLEEDDQLEEKLIVDMEETKAGWIVTDEPTLKRENDMEAAKEAADADADEDSEEEDTNGVVNDLHETISALAAQNEKLESVIYQLQAKLEETLLSNAKLIYQNRTLSDASLNERQKTKIVEAIAAAESPKEAKQLHETLKATVGSSSKKHGPQSLSESVNRRSNLSSMLNTRQNISEGQNHDPFLDKMKKLAGIK